MLLTAGGFRPRVAYAGESRGWNPIPEFNRTDADVSVFFLSQNAVAYLEPVYDPFFSAHSTYNDASSGQTLARPDVSVNAMICTEQYVVCNPSTSSCTPPGGWYHLSDAVFAKNTPGFNTAQRNTAGRIVTALAQSDIYTSVAGVGAGALWANNVAAMNISPGLPSNQWQIEVQGWFQTSLAKLQAYMVEYASNTAGLGPFGRIDLQYGNRMNVSDSEGDAALRAQCENQLVRTTGDVTNFSFWGVMIIACISAFLVALDFALGRIMNLLTRYLRFGSAAETARQADGNLHLLRRALGSPDEDGGRNGWMRGRWDVPLLDGDVSLTNLLLDGPN